MAVCYAFEAKSIQDYVLGSGKLKDMIGASALVDQLIEKPLKQVIEGVGLNENCIHFSRRAGGSFYALIDSRDKAEALRDLWSLVVPQFAPGLSFVHTIAEHQDGQMSAAKKAMTQLRSLRFPRTSMPSATPLTRLSPRSGMSAFSNQHKPGGGKEWVDSTVIRKREFALTEGMNYLLPDHTNYQWPRDMEQEFPFQGDNHYVGIIHADGNGLGKILLELQAASNEDNYIQLYSEFSERLTKATVGAAKDAINQVLAPTCESGFLPARPLVLGGDDLTIIVRADLAVAFTTAFLAAFEEKSQGLCTYLKDHTNWSMNHLTACAGIAYVKANQPFSMAYALAEELCGKAKNSSNRQVSSLSFHAISTSFIPDIDWVQHKEMTTGTSEYKFISTMGCYKINNQQSDDEKAGNQLLPHIKDLRALQAVLTKSAEYSGSSSMRKLIGIAHEPPQVAEKVYRRWRKLLEDGGQQSQSSLHDFDACLARIMGEEKVSHKLPASLDDSGDIPVYTSPIGDVLALNSVEKV